MRKKEKPAHPPRSGINGRQTTRDNTLGPKILLQMGIIVQGGRDRQTETDTHTETERETHTERQTERERDTG